MSIKWDTLKTSGDLDLERYEQEADLVRAKRDNLIAKTDYYMLQDSPPATTGLEEYRQSLRDITMQDGFPFSVIWPEKPA